MRPNNLPLISVRQGDHTIEIDPYKVEVKLDGHYLKIGMREMAVLMLLASHPFTGFSIEQIMAHANIQTPNVTRVLIHHVQTKLEQKFIRWVARSEYQFCVEE